MGPTGKSRGPHGEITRAPRGNHVGPTGKSRGKSGLPAYIVSGYDTLAEAASGIFRKEFFDENMLMSVASIGAIAIGEYPEAVFVMLFNKIGSLFESVAVGSSRKSIKALTSMKPATARVIKDGVAEELAIGDVMIGDLVSVRPGERIPVDGTVTDGESFVDTSALTGESRPVRAAAGERVLSGSIALDGSLTVETDTVFEESTEIGRAHV